MLLYALNEETYFRHQIVIGSNLQVAIVSKNSFYNYLPEISIKQDRKALQFERLCNYDDCLRMSDEYLTGLDIIFSIRSRLNNLGNPTLRSKSTIFIL